MEKVLQLTAVITREGNGYVATFPELDVVSEGDTVEEARSNLLEAVEGFLRDGILFRDSPPPQEGDLRHADYADRADCPAQINSEVASCLDCASSLAERSAKSWPSMVLRSPAQRQPRHHAKEVQWHDDHCACAGSCGIEGRHLVGNHQTIRPVSHPV